MLCAFTGHRPQKLPWGNAEEDPRCQALKIMIARAVDQAVERGCTGFLCGMARGCDLWFAEAVLDKGYDLIAMLPCAAHAEGWPERDRLRMQALLERCSEICFVEQIYSEGCMLRRNRAMVDRAELLISVYDGSGGGTGSTVRYAKSCGVELMPIWL